MKKLATLAGLLVFLAAVGAKASTLAVTLDGCTVPCTLQVAKDAPFTAYDLSWGLRGPDGNTWNANLYSVTALKSVVGAEAYQDYLQAFDIIANDGGTFTSDDQLAVYALFAPWIQTSKYWTSGAASIYGSVESQTFSASEFAGYSVLIPVTGCGAEPSCFALPPGTEPTPEPSAMLLLGTGLIGLGWLMKNRVVAHETL